MISRSFRNFSSMISGIWRKTLGMGLLSMIRDYRGISGHGKVFNSRIRDRICDLARALAEAETAEEFQEKTTQFYREFGVGKLGFTRRSG